MALQISMRPEGDLALEGFDETALFLLNDLPAILHYRADPGVQARMFPDALPGDLEANDAWHDAMDAELEYLFASAEELMLKDLEGLDEGGVLAIPATHLDAWMNGLNQARIILGELYGIVEEDMHNENPDPGRDRDVAVYRINFYAWLLQILLEIQAGTWAEED